jgi:hypothetical protein
MPAVVMGTGRLLVSVFPMIVRYFPKIFDAAVQCVVQLGIFAVPPAIKMVRKKWPHRLHHHQGGTRHSHAHVSHPHSSHHLRHAKRR